MRFLLCVITGGALALVARTYEGIAHARPETVTAELDGPSERRSGVVLGLDLGAGLMTSSGYPNSAVKVNDPRYHAASGALVGTGESLFLMGALADVLNFGIWLGAGTYENDHWRSTGVAGGFRVDVFPLYALVPRLRDLGLAAKFGVGATELRAKHGESPGADGTSSYLGAGVFYELDLFHALGGHGTLAPLLEVQWIDTPSIERHGAVVGLRLAFYGGM